MVSFEPKTDCLGFFAWKVLNSFFSVWMSYYFLVVIIAFSIFLSLLMLLLISWSLWSGVIDTNWVEAATYLMLIGDEASICSWIWIISATISTFFSEFSVGKGLLMEIFVISYPIAGRFFSAVSKDLKFIKDLDLRCWPWSLKSFWKPYSLFCWSRKL